jgi:hypothetical protein
LDKCRSQKCRGAAVVATPSAFFLDKKNAAVKCYDKNCLQPFPCLAQLTFFLLNFTHFRQSNAAKSFSILLSLLVNLTAKHFFSGNFFLEGKEQFCKMSCLNFKIKFAVKQVRIETPPAGLAPCLSVENILADRHLIDLVNKSINRLSAK